MNPLESALDKLKHPFETPRQRTARRKAEKRLKTRRAANLAAVKRCQARKKAERRAARIKLVHDRNLIKPSDSPAERRRKKRNRYMQRWRATRLQRAAKKLNAERTARSEAKRQIKFAIEQQKAAQREARRLKELGWAEGFATAYQEIMVGREPLPMAQQKSVYGPKWRKGYADCFNDPAVREAARQSHSMGFSQAKAAKFLTPTRLSSIPQWVAW